MTSLFGPRAHAQQRTYNLLTTGNGFGFQIFDYSQNKISQFLEHPYRYLGPNPSDPHAEGIVRRNLAYDVYFGVRNATDKGWVGGNNTTATTSTPEYVDQTHIIHAPSKQGSISADSYFFAPFDYPGNAMVALLKAPAATDAYVLFNFHMGTGTPDSPGYTGESVFASTSGHAVIETGPGGGYLVYVPLSAVDHEDCSGVYNKLVNGQDLADNTSCAADDTVPGFQRHFVAADNGWMGVAVQYVDGTKDDANKAAAALVTWANGRSPDKILADARAEFETWRKPVPSGVSLCSDAEKAVWRQSEAVLRMGQVREPNSATRKNNGMMLASLMGAGSPYGNWHTGWVRDGSYAIVALARMGHYDEAKAALQFFLNAGPVGGYANYVNNVNYRISLTRYYGNGQEECDWNSNGPNVETDGWGLVLWAARTYVEASGDTAWLSSTATANGAAVYDLLQAQVAAPIESNLESSSIMRADSSIWESHQPGKHYLYTTMAATRGLCDMAALAKKQSKANDQTHYAQLSGKIKTAFLSGFLDPHQALGGSTEGLQGGHYYDGSTAEVFNWSLIPDYTGQVAVQTFNVLNQLRVQTGGFKRNDDGLSDYDNNEWILVDLRMADALRRAGQSMDADALIAQVVQRASVNFNLLPELYNDTPADGQLGIYFGSIPMVGYGAGAYVMTILDRSGVGEANDCGDGNSRGLQQWTCSGATGGSGGTGGGGSGGTGGGGSGGTGGGGSGGTGGGGSGGTGGGMGDGGAGSDVPYRAACLCDLGGAGATGGTLFVLLVPWLFIAMRLARRTRP